MFYLKNHLKKILYEKLKFDKINLQDFIKHDSMHYIKAWSFRADTLIYSGLCKCEMYEIYFVTFI